jgi:hypothetical protein
MTGWLDSLVAELDEASEPVVFFFRDDDAGWRDDLLVALLDVFEHAGAQVDVAAIPTAVSPLLGRILGERQGTVRVHQHGLAHVNHEPAGRKCEFGPARQADVQLADILAGRRLLLDRLEAEPDPIFTPPWNRCTADTARAVRDAGLEVLSRESRAEPLHVNGVCELPVSVDWVRPAPRAALGEALAAAARDDRPVGVMLHHAVMDGEQRGGVAELLDVLGSSSTARLAGMSEIARAGVSA